MIDQNVMMVQLLDPQRRQELVEKLSQQAAPPPLQGPVGAFGPAAGPMGAGTPAGVAPGQLAPPSGVFDGGQGQQPGQIPWGQLAGLMGGIQAPERQRAIGVAPGIGQAQSPGPFSAVGAPPGAIPISLAQALRGG